MTAWFVLVFPALLLNYLGQGALVLTQPESVADPFFHLAPERLLPALVALATVATVIASQAVISGAFSMARAAIQLGLLPRMMIRHTAHDQSGQIYIGAVNWALLAGVLFLALSFGSSSELAAAYGIAVTGTMLVTSALLVLYLARVRGMRLWLAALAVLPLAALETGFLAANLTKLVDGGYVPAMIALVLGIVMWAWWRGTQHILVQSHRSSVSISSFVRSMGRSSVTITPGTAFFLAPDPQIVPPALLHNLRHNRVLHDQTVFLTVETLRVPYATPEERATFTPLGPHFAQLTLRFGFMETPNVSRAMVSARKAGLKFDTMASSFFLGRRRPVVTGPAGPARILDRLYALLARFAADPSAFFHLPRNLVVEMGERVSL
jgi:KUP system potassium uptake protein